MKHMLAIIMGIILLCSAVGLADIDGSGAAGAAGGAAQMVGDDRDEHGCIGSAGYTWCEPKQKCLRAWEEACQIGDDPIMGPNVQPPVVSNQSAETIIQVREQVQIRKQEMAQEAAQMGAQQQAVYQNQNEVRLAVHALLEMKDVLGGIGQNVSSIAREFNNSVQATIRAEERIERRSAISRFFAGGDREAAEEIEVEVNQNRVRIEQLKQLMNQCNCTGDTKAFMLEQIQDMELEQTRLQLLSEGEKQSKGIFGWLWK